MVSREVVPGEVQRARAFRGGTTAGDHAWRGLEVEALRGGPQFEGGDTGGAGDVGGGPGGRVEVEVADKDCGDVGG